MASAFRATHLFLASLRTTPEGLLRPVLDRWSIEGWHWIRDTQLQEDATGTAATPPARWPQCADSAALNLMRLAGFQPIRAGMQAMMHEMTARCWRWRGDGRTLKNWLTF
jgi:hypothetical protein